MSEEEVKEYFPIIGDRLAVKDYASKGKSVFKKNSLVELLRKKNDKEKRKEST